MNYNLKTADIMFRLGISRQTVKDLVDSGKLNAVKLGRQYRFSEKDFNDYVFAGITHNQDKELYFDFYVDNGCVYLFFYAWIPFKLQGKYTAQQEKIKAKIMPSKIVQYYYLGDLPVENDTIFSTKKSCSEYCRELNKKK